jgi:SAM-dependent methyltransferase
MNTDIDPPSGQTQAALWNGDAGLAWVETQALMDRVLEPFEHALVEAVREARGRAVLDVGCGTGATTLAIAAAVAPGGRATGIDISEPMIAKARERAAREHVAASFVCADAQRHVLEPASFDTVTSRFGVMFFDDPVAAFANLRRAVSAEGHLRAIVWRDAAENPFMTAAERAAAPLLPHLPARRSDGPGQFAFADEALVRRILERSGWSGVTLRPVDAVCTFPERELLRYVTRLGPLGRVLAEADEATRARVLATVRPAFDSYVRGDEVRFAAACWMIGARSPDLIAAPKGASQWIRS